MAYLGERNALMVVVSFFSVFPLRVRAWCSTIIRFHRTFVACCSQYAAAMTRPLVLVQMGGASVSFGRHVSMISCSCGKKRYVFQDYHQHEKNLRVISDAALMKILKLRPSEMLALYLPAITRVCVAIGPACSVCASSID